MRVPTSLASGSRPPLGGDATVTTEKASLHVFLGALPYSVLTPNHETKSPLARLALMEYDIRPHEAYDEVVAATCSCLL